MERHRWKVEVEAKRRWIRKSNRDSEREQE